MAAGVQVLLVIPGVLVGLLGAAMVAKPRRVGKLQEQMDAIGSKRDLEDVEPTEWTVLFNQLFGTGILLVGSYAILGGLGIIPV